MSTLFDRGPTLTNFAMKRPAKELPQGRSLAWLTKVHAAAQATMEKLDASAQKEFEARLERLVARCACNPEKIGSRGTVVTEMESTDFTTHPIYDVANDPHGKGMGARNELYEKVVRSYFEETYADETRAPADMIHVSCTGYVSPSGAQRVVEKKGWGDRTRVTHAYHMGCYAAFPAARLAAGCLSMPYELRATRGDRRVDIVHTELCTLHLDPAKHSAEQLVVQSLFADGFIRYSMRDDAESHGLRLLALDERIVPDSSDSMGWVLSDHGLAMNLSRDVPSKIAATLRAFVIDLYEKAHVDLGKEMARTVFAVHPGGPKIIDGVADVLELQPHQVEASKKVLFDYGNMSSATLPHVWMRIVDDPSIPRGTHVASLAFGPGLSVCGGLFRKV